MSVADTPTVTPRKAPPYQRFDPSRVKGWMTREEYIAFERTSSRKHAYIQGRVVEVAGASYEHNVICGNLLYALKDAAKTRSIRCTVLPSEQRVFISDRIYYYPDLTLVLDRAQIDDFDALRNPFLIAEVLSPSTEHEDRTQKLRDYQSLASLRHYLLIDQYRPSVIHYEKTVSDQWSVSGIHTDLSDSLHLILASQSITISLSAIYEQIEFTEETGPIPVEK